ncbi:MAG: YjbQ family protein [Gammaproteobacteria bacterium]|nr:MAG: YjbQ family protein [Gammaproteobacteria bacterium]
MVIQKSIIISTPGRGSLEITAKIDAIIAECNVRAGLCHVFVQHTSASLMICENADPDVRRDLEAFMSRIAPDGDPIFLHTAEGPDDMPAHVRSVLTQTGLSVPVVDGHCELGTWQGIFLWEHRTNPHQRRITITLLN